MPSKFLPLLLLRLLLVLLPLRLLREEEVLLLERTELLLLRLLRLASAGLVSGLLPLGGAVELVVQLGDQSKELAARRSASRPANL